MKTLRVDPPPRRINTLANKITFARILVALVANFCIWKYLYGSGEFGYLVATIVLFVTAAGTDSLDGYVARKRNEESALGKILDPVADRVLICVLFFVNWQWTLVIVGIEALSAVCAWMVMKLRGHTITKTSKVTSFLQFVAIGLILFGTYQFPAFVDFLFQVVLILSLVRMGSYLMYPLSQKTKRLVLLVFFKIIFPS